MSKDLPAHFVAVEKKCSRCGSEDVQLDHFNNLSESQPRYYCFGCNRKFTLGGKTRACKPSRPPRRRETGLPARLDCVQARSYEAKLEDQCATSATCMPMKDSKCRDRNSQALMGSRQYSQRLQTNWRSLENTEVSAPKSWAWLPARQLTNERAPNWWAIDELTGGPEDFEGYMLIPSDGVVEGRSEPMISKHQNTERLTNARLQTLAPCTGM